MNFSGHIKHVTLKTFIQHNQNNQNFIILKVKHKQRKRFILIDSKNILTDHVQQTQRIQPNFMTVNKIFNGHRVKLGIFSFILQRHIFVHFICSYKDIQQYNPKNYIWLANQFCVWPILYIPSIPTWMRRHVGTTKSIQESDKLTKFIKENCGIFLQFLYEHFINVKETFRSS